MDLTLEALDAEWRRIVRSSEAHRALIRWADATPLLAAGSLDELLERRFSPDGPDILRSLAQRAPSERLAARTLLQALLPGLGVLAGQVRRRDGSTGELITLTWERIRTYPIRRPGPVAGNVLLDVRKTYVADRRREAREASGIGRCEAIVPSAEDVVLDRCAEAEVVRAVHAARTAGVVNDVAFRAIVRTRLRGDEIDDVAVDEDLSVRELQLRRWRGERALREHLELALAG